MAHLDSRHLVQGSYPGATVSIFLAGTTALAAIYADNAAPPTPKANPFTAATDGSWYAYAPNGRYDVRFSGAGIGEPFTVGDLVADDSGITVALQADGGRGATIRSGDGDPESVVDGNAGDLFLRLDGGARTTLYVKESGAGTNTGWVAK